MSVHVAELDAAVPAALQVEASEEDSRPAQSNDPWAQGDAQPQQQRSRVVNLRDDSGLVKSMGVKPNPSLPYWTISIERWQSMMAPSKPVVVAEDQLPSPPQGGDWATYLNAVHVKLHAVFSDSFLASLDSLGKNHRMNRDAGLHAVVELVINGATGKLVSERIIQTSGVRLFDAGALASIAKALPAATVIDSIVSSDGRVYVHWRLNRNPDYACSTWFAHGYKLDVEGKAEIER